MNERLISKKKPFYPISIELSKYLKDFNRWINGSIFYEDLLRFSGSVSVLDKNDNEQKELDFNLKKIYTTLHSDGNDSSIPYLNVDSIDYCTFGNSKPFRIKIRNVLNDNFFHSACLGIE